MLKQTGSAATGDIAVTLYNAYADQIDTVRVITQQDHTIAWRWDGAEAFGATAPDQDPSSLGAFVFNQRFPGQVFDAETGLNQNWHREYQARWGRYAQSDPIGLVGGINTYAYAGGNPLSAADPSGELLNPAGMALGAAIELAMQAFQNYSDGCDLFDVDNYAGQDILVAALVGNFTPGAFRALRGVWPSWIPFVGSSRGAGGAIRALWDQLGRATTPNRIAKLEGRIADHISDIGRDVAYNGAWQRLNGVYKDMARPGERPCSCRAN